jgi:hypothetical protein
VLGTDLAVAGDPVAGADADLTFTVTHRREPVTELQP